MPINLADLVISLDNPVIGSTDFKWENVNDG